MLNLLLFYVIAAALMAYFAFQFPRFYWLIVITIFTSLALPFFGGGMRDQITLWRWLSLGIGAFVAFVTSFSSSLTSVYVRVKKVDMMMFMVFITAGVLTVF